MSYFISRNGLTQVIICVSQNEQKIAAQIGHMNVIGTAGIMILEVLLQERMVHLKFLNQSFLMFEILLKVSTLDECKDRCLMNQPACTAVAYTTPQNPTNPNRCWMKTALENCRVSEGYITGNSHHIYLAVTSEIA